MTTTPIIVAFDFERRDQALEAAQKLDPAKCQIKIGKGLFTRYGPELVEQLMTRGFKIFLDLKFHDIPNTVALACRAAADLGIWMLNVHALGGSRMMHAALDAVKQSAHPPLLIGVTVLTSMDSTDLAEIGIHDTPQHTVLRLAELVKKAGLNGVVCSAQEAALLRAELGKQFLLVTPGIRLAEQSQDDQRRITTPRDAMKNGSDYIVVGRAVMEADEPSAKIDQILEDIGVG